MDDLVAWLRHQIDEDERVARATLSVGTRANMRREKPAPRWIRDGSRIRDDAPGPTILRVGHTWAREADHIARHDPARVLAEVAAKRKVLDLRDSWAREAETAPPQASHLFRAQVSAADAVIRALAQPFAGRPGWREEWAT